MIKALKLLGGFFAALFVSALASGFWERVLSPAFNYLGEFITRVLSGYSQSYSDSIYSSASWVHGGTTNAELALIFFFIGSSIAVLLALRKILTVDYLPGSEEERAFSYMDGWLLAVGGGILLFMSLFYMTKHSAIREVRAFALTNMDIARPYVGDEQYHVLMSDFLRINTEKDFDSFQELLIESSRKAGVNIGAFEK